MSKRNTGDDILGTIKKISAFPFIILIRFYQLALSPYLGGRNVGSHPLVLNIRHKLLKSMDQLKEYS